MWAGIDQRICQAHWHRATSYYIYSDEYIQNTLKWVYMHMHHVSCSMFHAFYLVSLYIFYVCVSIMCLCVYVSALRQLTYKVS